MSKRIRKLEDALQIAHSALNSGHHPLLSEELLEIKNGTARSSLTDSETNDDPPEDLENVLDSYGSLTLSDRGTEEYVAGAIVSFWRSSPLLNNAEILQRVIKELLVVSDILSTKCYFN